MRMRGGLSLLVLCSTIYSEWRGVREIDTTWWGCVLRGNGDSADVGRLGGSEWNYSLWFGCLFPPSQHYSCYLLMRRIVGFVVVTIHAAKLKKARHEGPAQVSELIVRMIAAVCCFSAWPPGPDNGNVC
jgi:hypothetical protein